MRLWPDTVKISIVAAHGRGMRLSHDIVQIFIVVARESRGRGRVRGYIEVEREGRRAPGVGIIHV